MSGKYSYESELDIHLEQLNRISSNCSRTTEEIPAEDLLSELNENKKSTLEAVNIAKTFYKHFKKGLAKTQKTTEKNELLENRIEEVTSKMQESQNELFAKDQKIEYLTTEVTELEHNYKSLINENKKLKAEVKQVRRELKHKEDLAQMKGAQTPKQPEKKEKTKELEAKVEELSLDLERKTEEIEDFNYKLKEVQNLHQVEKSAAERLRTLNNQLKEENEDYKSKNEDYKQLNSELEEKVKKMHTELIQQRTYTDSLVREYDKMTRSRNNSVLEPPKKSEPQEPQEPQETLKPETPQESESLGDFMEEIENPPQEDNVVFFINSSTKVFETSKTKTISIQPKPKKFSTSTVSISVEKLKKQTLGVTHSTTIQILGSLSSCPTETSTKPHLQIIPTRKELSTVLVSSVGCASSFFNFNDGASMYSTESSTPLNSRRDRPRDIIFEYFQLTVQAAKLNSPYKDKISRIRLKQLYGQAMQENVPFNKWHDWAQAYMHRNLLS